MQVVLFPKTKTDLNKLFNLHRLNDIIKSLKYIVPFNSMKLTFLKGDFYVVLSYLVFTNIFYFP